MRKKEIERKRHWEERILRKDDIEREKDWEKKTLGGKSFNNYFQNPLNILHQIYSAKYTLSSLLC